MIGAFAPVWILDGALAALATVACFWFAFRARGLPGWAWLLLIAGAVEGVVTVGFVLARLDVAGDPIDRLTRIGGFLLGAFVHCAVLWALFLYVERKEK